MQKEVTHLSLNTAVDTLGYENLNKFSITDADMQIILDDLTVDMDQVLVGLTATVSKVPIEDWIALLETSGWGVIEDTHFFYA